MTYTPHRSVGRPSFVLAVLLLLASPLVHAGTGGGPFVSGIMRGTDGNEVITGMARFSNGDVVVCGYLPYATGSWDDAPGFDHEFNGGEDAFIAVLDDELVTVKAFTLFGGRENDRATAVAVRNDETIIVTGTTRSDDLPVSSGSIAPLYSAGVDGFLVAFDPQLAEVQFGTYIVGSGDEHPMNIALDGSGSIYLCGTTTSSTGFPTNNGYDQQYEGGTDGFVMRISPNAASILFSTYYGSEGYDEIVDIDLDNSGSIYLAGTTQSANFPTFPYVESRWWWRFRDRPYDWTYNGGNSDAFLLVLSEDGAQCIVATFYGGEGEDEATGVVYSDGDVTLIGHTDSPDLLVDGGQQGYLNGRSDVFLASFDALGRTIKGATYFGGSGEERVRGAVPGPANNILLWGTTNSRDMQVGGYGSRQEIYGAEDAFFATVGIGTSSIVSTIGGTATDTLSRCLVEPDGSILMAGHTLSRQIPLDTGVLVHTGPQGTATALVARYAPGTIGLTAPGGRVLRCEGQPLTVSYSLIEMRGTDRFVIQASLDQQEWRTVVGPTDRNNVTWTIDDPQYVGQEVYVRVLSSRRHVSWSSDAITVDPAPVVVRQPAEVVDACAGTTVALNVDVSGQSLSYQWRFNGKPLPGATEATLERINVSTSDVGTYDVMVTAACGTSIMSETARLRVVDQAEIVQQPSDLVVTEGKTIILSCEAIGSSVTYQWYHFDELLTGKTEPTLLIANASAEDAGEYHCAISSDCGDATSETATVEVQPAVSVAELTQPGSEVFRAGRHPVTDVLVIGATDAALLAGPYSIVAVTGEVVATGHGSGSDPELRHQLMVPNGAYVFVQGLTRIPFLVHRP